MISSPPPLAIRLHRRNFYAICIVGDFIVADETGALISWKSLELPLSVRFGLVDQANVPGQCCIPASVNGDKYRVVLQWSPRHLRLLPHVLNVPGREAIEMHPASRPSDLLGCIAIGKNWIGMEPQSKDDVVITGSQQAFYREFEPIYLKARGVSSADVANEKARGMKPVEIGTLEITNDFLTPITS